jgi:hypothetical protein
MGLEFCSVVREKGARERAFWFSVSVLSGGWVLGGGFGCFVPDRGSDFLCEFRRDLGDAMDGAGVFGALFHHFLLGFASCNEVAVDADVATVYGFCHLLTST